MADKIKALAEKYYPVAERVRCAVHSYPELGFEEFETQKLIMSVLREHGIEPKAMAKTGVTALVEGAKKGKTVLLRADMDALRLTETAEVPYKSTRKGFMHACGHDGHVAALLASALILKELAGELSGAVKLMFQPAEESVGGALPMIEEGILENPKVDAAFACHLWGSAPVGEIWIGEGAIMAAPDEFKLVVKGKGGHAAMPHLAVDPVVIAAEIITAFQHLVARAKNPLDPLVISVCSIHGGEVHNVIPAQVELRGTVRTLNGELRLYAHSQMKKISAMIAESWGGGAELEIYERFPALVNDPAATAIARSAALKIVGKDKVKTCEPSMGGEDFAYIAHRVPSSFFFVGIRKNEPVFHHNGDFRWDNEVLKTASAALAQTAAEFLISG